MPLKMRVLASCACLGLTTAPFAVNADSYRVLGNGFPGILELNIDSGHIVTGTIYGDPIKGFQGADGSVTFVRSGGTQTWHGWFQQVDNLREYDGYFIDVTSGTPTRHVFAWRATH